MERRTVTGTEAGTGTRTRTRPSSRRALLATGGATLVATLAGCVARGNDDDHKSGLEGEPVEGSPSDHVVIADHAIHFGHTLSNCTYERGPGERANRIERNVVGGTVSNGSATSLERVVVAATVSDHSGGRLGVYTDEVDGLESMASREFEILVFEPATEIDDYEVTIETLEW